MTRAVRWYPICRGPLDQSGLGSGHPATRAQATLQLAICEFENVLQYIVIYIIILLEQLILVFFTFFSTSAALAQNTRGITTVTTMDTAGGNGPLASHMRPCAPRRHIKWMGNNPPSLRIIFWGGIEDVYGPQSASLFRWWCIPTTLECLRAIHTLNSPKKYIRLLGGLSTVHLTHWIGAQGLMWGTRGPFPPAAAMVCYGCVGRCWSLEADVRSTYCRNSNNYLRTYFLFLCRSHTFLTSDPAS